MFQPPFPEEMGVAGLMQQPGGFPGDFSLVDTGK